MEYRIAKSYYRKVVVNFQSHEFHTELSKTIDVNSAEELQAENDKLFDQCKALTEADIEKCKDEIWTR